MPGMWQIVGWEGTYVCSTACSAGWPFPHETCQGTSAKVRPQALAKLNASSPTTFLRNIWWKDIRHRCEGRTSQRKATATRNSGLQVWLKSLKSKAWLMKDASRLHRPESARVVALSLFYWTPHNIVFLACLPKWHGKHAFANSTSRTFHFGSS